MSHQDPLILIVNENDEPVGSATKQDAQDKDLIHRITHVMVEDPDGRVLLQKRAANSKLYPGCWDPAVGGHVDEGEDYDEAAKREMYEEIGLKGVDLQELGIYRKNEMFEGRHLNRFYKVFKAIVPPETKFKLEPTEVSEVRWFMVDEVKQLISEQPDKLAGGLVEAITRYY